MKKIEKIVDLVTGEETVLEREETIEEKDLRKKLELEAETKAAQKQAILDRIGLTADEAKLLLG